jgi:dTDP-4-amino-4,6-dideoxygalactose transaminase
MIPISRPYLGDAELAAVQNPIRDGWVVQGPRVAEFEAKFAEFTGAAHAVATTSCTTALHIAVAALGAGPGDEVIVPAFTWISTANVVRFVGAKPVFCDVELDTFNLNPEALAAAVSERTVGVIPVHLFGLPADMQSVATLADRHNLWVVEDAACAFGTKIGWRHAGTFGDAGCFSFHPRKSITTGEGGMLITDDEQLAALARSLRDHGASRSDHARHNAPSAFKLADYQHIGFNYRMTDLQGAIGAAQMDRAEWVLSERTRQAERYRRELADLSWLRLPSVPAEATHGWQAFVCLYAPEEPTLSNLAELHEARNMLMAQLEDEGIATRQGTHAPVDTAIYQELYAFSPEQFPAARIAEALSLALPLFAGLSDEDVSTVIEAIHRLGP